MKKTIIIVAALALLLGAGAYLISQDRSIQSQEAMLKEAYLGRGSVVCTFTDPGELGERDQVTAHIKNGQIRYFSEKGLVFEGEALFKDNTYYFWKGNEGIKIVVDEDDFLPFTIDDGEVYIHPDDYHQLNCKKEYIDDDMFEVPGDIDFFDLSENDFDLDDYYYEDVELEDGDLEEYYQELYESMELDPETLETIEELEGLNF